jgi:hypothetical protein
MNRATAFDRAISVRSTAAVCRTNVKIVFLAAVVVRHARPNNVHAMQLDVNAIPICVRNVVPMIFVATINKNIKRNRFALVTT